MSERRGGGLLRLLRGAGQPRLEDAPGHIIWGVLRGSRRGNAPSRPVPARPASSGRDAWRHSELQVRPVAIDTAKDPRYQRERAGGYGSTAPYLPRTRNRGPAPKDPRPRTSSEFRRLRRMGFELRQARGEILAVPVDLELIELIGSKPIAIGRAIA